MAVFQRKMKLPAYVENINCFYVQPHLTEFGLGRLKTAKYC